MNHWYLYKRNLLKLPRMKASPWTCCVPQPAGSAATSKITWWRPDFYPFLNLWAEFKGMQERSVLSVFVHERHTHSTVIYGWFVQWSGWSWLTGWFAFRCAPIWMVSILEPRIVGGLGWSSCHGQKLQIIRNQFDIKCKAHAMTGTICSTILCAPDSVVFSPNISGT